MPLHQCLLCRDVQQPQGWLEGAFLPLKSPLLLCCSRGRWPGWISGSWLRISTSGCVSISRGCWAPSELHLGSGAWAGKDLA